jgi:hypothetical protein
VTGKCSRPILQLASRFVAVTEPPKNLPSVVPSTAEPAAAEGYPGWALYQGMASAVPNRRRKRKGFSSPEFKKAMNENRAATGARLLFP